MPRNVRPRVIQREVSSFRQPRRPSRPTALGAIHPAFRGGFPRIEDFASLLEQDPDVRRAVPTD